MADAVSSGQPPEKKAKLVDPAIFYYLKNVKNVNNIYIYIYIYIDCLFPKKENKENKTDWLAERRNIRMYNARLVLL